MPGCLMLFVLGLWTLLRALLFGLWTLLRALLFGSVAIALEKPLADSARLPQEWHKTIGDPLLVFGVSGQISAKEAFLVEKLPYQKWHHRDDGD
jgi:hypothetical protein